MAGVGFELKKLFSRQGLLAKVRAYGYSGIICTGPMLLGVLMQIGLKILADFFGRSKFDQELLVCMITYTLLASLLVTSILSMVVTRFLSDMIYETQLTAIMPSFWGSTGMMLVIGGIVYGIFLCFSGATLMQGILCWVIFGELVVVWNAMSYLTAIKDYSNILKSFVVAVIIVFGMTALGFALDFPTVTTVLLAVYIGYGVMMIWDVSILYQGFPASEESAFLFLRWCDQFSPLALTGLFTTLGMFGHLVVMWLGPLQVQVKGLFVGAPSYDIPALLAFLTILVTTVNFVVSVEVNFYPKYRNYYALFNDKGGIEDILLAEKEMLIVLKSELWYTGLKQLFATGLAVSLGGVLLPMLPLGINDLMLGYFRVLCVGYGLYAIGNTVMLILLYFTDYVGAVCCTALFSASTMLFTLLSLLGDPVYFGFGFLLGSALFFLAAVLRMEWFTRRLPYFILSRQPVVAEEKSGVFTRMGEFLHKHLEEEPKWIDLRK